MHSVTEGERGSLTTKMPCAKDLGMEGAFDFCDYYYYRTQEPKNVAGCAKSVIFCQKSDDNVRSFGLYENVAVPKTSHPKLSHPKSSLPFSSQLGSDLVVAYHIVFIKVGRNEIYAWHI